MGLNWAWVEQRLGFWVGNIRLLPSFAAAGFIELAKSAQPSTPIILAGHRCPRSSPASLCFAAQAREDFRARVSCVASFRRCTRRHSYHRQPPSSHPSLSPLHDWDGVRVLVVYWGRTTKQMQRTGTKKLKGSGVWVSRVYRANTPLFCVLYFVFFSFSFFFLFCNYNSHLFNLK